MMLYVIEGGQMVIYARWGGWNLLTVAYVPLLNVDSMVVSPRVEKESQAGAAYRRIHTARKAGCDSPPPSYNTIAVCIIPPL